jgi:hypothetical protein
MSLKRFVLNVFTDGELDEVVVGLSDINSYVTIVMQHPPVEDLVDECVDLYEFKGEFEEEDNE